MVFDPTQRRIRQNTTDAYATNVTRMANGMYNLTFPYVVPNIYAGDYAVVRGSGAEVPAATLLTQLYFAC